MKNRGPRQAGDLAFPVKYLVFRTKRFRRFSLGKGEDGRSVKQRLRLEPGMQVRVHHGFEPHKAGQNPAPGICEGEVSLDLVRRVFSNGKLNLNPGLLVQRSTKR